MYNYLRWFPKGKVVFMAPTRPLVAQQIESCYKVVGISKDISCELTGGTKPENRKVKWQDNRMFYLTPQTFIKDLQSGICDAKSIVLVVIDEAHKATGNYAYCEVIKFLLQRDCVFRVLALSATPGSDAKGVQDVINNIIIQKIEIRTEESLDIYKYLFIRAIKEEIIIFTKQMEEISQMFINCFDAVLQRLVKYKVFNYVDAEAVASYPLILARDRLSTFF
jgi:Fanconi anemia group M protein